MRVPSQFPAEKPKIAFVTEYPFPEDVIKQKPLQGPIGRVFNMLLRSADIDRDEVYIGHVFDEMLPGDGERDQAKALAEWKKDPVRTDEAFARLNEELTRMDAPVIVPLGGTALWAFTGDAGISKSRGAVTPASRIMPGAKLIPTYHPQSVQRAWHLLTFVVGDFEKAMIEANLGPGFFYPKVELLIEPTVADVRRYAEECMASPKLSVDIETGWGQITSIAFASTTSRAMAVPFVDLRKPNKSYWPTVDDEVAVWRVVEEICGAPNPKVGQNFMYDLFWLHQKHGVTVRNYRHDTRLKHKVLYPSLAADLANMSATYTNVGSYKGWGGRYQKETKKDG